MFYTKRYFTIGSVLTVFGLSMISNGCHPLPIRSQDILTQLSSLNIDATALYDNFNSQAYVSPLVKVQTDDSLLLVEENARPNNEESIDQIKAIIEQVADDANTRSAAPFPEPVLAHEKQTVLELINQAITTENRKPIQ